MGKNEFNKAIGGFYQRYYESGATTEKFIAHLKSHSQVDLDKMIKEWAYTAEFVKQIESNTSYKQILAHYR